MLASIDKLVLARCMWTIWGCTSRIAMWSRRRTAIPAGQRQRGGHGGHHLDGISETTLTVTDLSFTDLLGGAVCQIVPEGGLTVRLWGLSEEIEAITAENPRATADMRAP